jgi:hypothetical protein
MQIPLHTLSSVDTYIRNHEWRVARLSACPLHPSGGCSFARHGSYARVTPPGLRIARWYCPEGHRTFSLLPDFLAAGLSGLLDAVEDSVAVAHSARSMEAAADLLRGPDVSLPGAVRWLRRRVCAVRAALDAVSRLVPELPAGGPGVDRPGLLCRLRRILQPAVQADIPAPLGFRASRRVQEPGHDDQHGAGPDGGPASRYDRAVNPVGVPCNTIHPMPQPPRPPPETCAASGVPTTACATTALCCTFNGSAVSDSTARHRIWTNVPS